MDPLTQGTLGAAFTQSFVKKRPQVRMAAGFGFLGGIAADIDVLIRSNTDPLLFLDYHRHFTHSLAFIPIGGLLCATLAHLLFRKRTQLPFLTTFLFCTLGYATHAVLDACTTYGTMLLWPFSDARMAWNVIAIIDPLFTLPMLAAVIAAVRTQNTRYAQAGMIWGALYMGLATLQHSQALTMAEQIAAGRGHIILRVEAKPSFGNILVWKTITETSDAFYVDAVRTGFAPKTFEGVQIAKLDISRDLPWLSPSSQQARDVERFRRFSDNFVAMDPVIPNRIIDVRYSFVPNDIGALWSIGLKPTADDAAHATYQDHRNNARAGVEKLWKMLTSAS
ncbi:MAG: metal-dependent hydrolase [Rhodospirillaceae bacterium]|nr:metal-dependent hydrolase [Rhodospirillaceae bacterium]